MRQFHFFCKQRYLKYTVLSLLLCPLSSSAAEEWKDVKGYDGAAGKEPARKAGKAHRQDHRPENKGRSGSAGRHPAGYRRHRAGRHGAEPSVRPAQGYCFRDTVIEFPPERFLRIEW